MEVHDRSFSRKLTRKETIAHLDQTVFAVDQQTVQELCDYSVRKYLIRSSNSSTTCGTVGFGFDATKKTRSAKRVTTISCDNGILKVRKKDYSEKNMRISFLGKIIIHHHYLLLSIFIVRFSASVITDIDK